MAACRWAECLLYEYGRHAKYVPKDKVISFWKVCLSLSAPQLPLTWCRSTELPRRPDDIFLQRGHHQDFDPFPLLSHLRICARISIRLVRGWRHRLVLFHRLRDRRCGWLSSRLVLLEQEPTRTVHRRGELLPVERHI